MADDVPAISDIATAIIVRTLLLPNLLRSADIIAAELRKSDNLAILNFIVASLKKYTHRDSLTIAS